MKFPELLFYSWRWNGKVELEGFLTYMSHVKSRIVYGLPDGRVVKLALPRVGSANLDEVVLACMFGDLFPKLLSHDSNINCRCHSHDEQEEKDVYSDLSAYISTTRHT